MKPCSGTTSGRSGSSAYAPASTSCCEGVSRRDPDSRTVIHGASGDRLVIKRVCGVAGNASLGRSCACGVCCAVLFVRCFTSLCVRVHQGHLKDTDHAVSWRLVIRCRGECDYISSSFFASVPKVCGFWAHRLSARLQTAEGNPVTFEGEGLCDLSQGTAYSNCVSCLDNVCCVLRLSCVDCISTLFDGLFFSFSCAIAFLEFRACGESATTVHDVKSLKELCTFLLVEPGEHKLLLKLLLLVQSVFFVSVTFLFFFCFRQLYRLCPVHVVEVANGVFCRNVQRLTLICDVRVSLIMLGVYLARVVDVMHSFRWFSTVRLWLGELFF